MNDIIKLSGILELETRILSKVFFKSLKSFLNYFEGISNMFENLNMQEKMFLVHQENIPKNELEKIFDLNINYAIFRVYFPGKNIDFNEKFFVTGIFKYLNLEFIKDNAFPDNNILEINLFLNTHKIKTNEDFINSLSEIYQELKKSIRHELEHYYQYKNKRLKKNKTTTEQKSEVDHRFYYLLAEIEKEAFVSEIYFDAKKTRQPFYNLLKDFLTNYMIDGHIIDSENGTSISKDYLKQKINLLISRYFSYAKKRFPKATIDESTINNINPYLL